MIRVLAGLTAIAAVFAVPIAEAGPRDASLWIGLEDGENGFLIDESTGDLWMTGICLRPLSKAVKTGTIWRSRTAEMVSVGRAMAMLDQTFELDVNAAAPSIGVNNPARGGLQAFPAAVLLACTDAGACSTLSNQPVCSE
jgi:hypothetical protein